MGVYLNDPSGKTPAKLKPEWLVAEHGAIPFERIDSLTQVPPGKWAVVVVDNGSWQAALVIATDHDLRRVLAEYSAPAPRRLAWLLMDRERVRPLVSERHRRELDHSER